MYRPHEAREDTVLFPAFRKIVPAKRIEELGEQFEKEEDRLFGEEGFEKTVDQVAAGATDGGASAVQAAYHGSLVPPFCNALVRGYFQQVLAAGL